MQRLACRNVQEYVALLDNDTAAAVECRSLTGVSISRFFRDARLWETLENRILPDLVERFPSEIRVWSAGCAGGEEVYSLKILWNRIGLSETGRPGLRITATDMNPAYLERAKTACYPSSSLREVPGAARTQHFGAESGGKRFRVKPEFTEGITWQVHDFFSGPPGSGFHLIFLRNNLFTYYRAPDIMPVLDAAIRALLPGGRLIIGSHERLPSPIPDLLPCPSLPYLFRKAE